MYNLRTDRKYFFKVLTIIMSLVLSFVLNNTQLTLAENTIDSIEINTSEPKANTIVSEFVNSVSVAEGSNYSIVNISNVSCVENDNIFELSGEDCFESGKTYSLKIFLESNDGSVFQVESERIYFNHDLFTASWHEGNIIDITFTVDDEISYTVVFDVDGGLLEGEVSQTVKQGERVSEPSLPTKEGHQFIGWYLGEEPFNFETTVESDLTLIAKWEEVITKDKQENGNGIMLNTPLLGNGNTNIYVSSTGSDSVGDGTEGNPYASVTKAYSVSSEGNTIVLLSDVEASSIVSIWHSVNIKSKQGEGPYKITRVAGFAPSHDRVRGSYHPAMFEVHSDNGPVEVRFENVIIDDNYLHEGSSYTWPSTSGSGNENRVQDAIIAIYEDPGKTNPATVVLGNDTTVQNYGGMCAVRIYGSTCKLIMEDGSLITKNNYESNSGAAVINSSGTFIMQKGSTLDKAYSPNSGAVALHSFSGSNYIDGTISNCTGVESGGDYATINLVSGYTEIGPNAKLFNNTSKHGTIYAIQGAQVIVAGEIYNNLTIDTMNYTQTRPTGSAVYVADNGAPATLYIEEGAYIHDNRARVNMIIGPFTIPMDNPLGSTVLANNTSYVYMNGGKISNNKTTYGVMVWKNGRFIMNDGEISSNNYGVELFDITPYGQSAQANKERIIINNGTISSNRTDIHVERNNAGYQNGSYVLLNEEMIQKEPRVTFSVDSKRIIPDKSMKELYLGNAPTKGIQDLENVEEVRELLATWFGSSRDGKFNFKVEGLTNRDEDVYVCLIPLDSNGQPQSNYKIFPCDKTVSGNRMTVSVNTKGTNNINGYVFGLFLEVPRLIITYDLNGGIYEGSKGPIVQKYEENTLIKILNAPTREGYEFLYWEGSIYYPGDEYKVIENHKFVAKWKKLPTKNPVHVPNTGDKK